MSQRTFYVFFFNRWSQTQEYDSRYDAFGSKQSMNASIAWLRRKQKENYPKASLKTFTVESVG